MTETLSARAGGLFAGRLEFDPAALRARYRAERDKRLDARQNEQFVEVAGDFARFADDPWAGPAAPRAAVRERVEALIVGGGFGGQLCAARLQKAGVGDFRIVEQAADFGGTWYWNRYPGAQCDIEAYIYMPLLEETGYIPSERYAHASELLEHAQRIGRHFGLYERTLFRTRITEMRWQAAERRWLVRTDQGDEIAARHVISSSGPLNRAKLPGIPGIGDFAGRAFHTSRWDYAYTGGHNRGALTGLADKRVAVIGTGATAIQCVPYLARESKALFVFQRTPSTVDVRGNRPTDPAWAASLTPGWQRRRMDNFNILVSGGRQDEDLVHDGWTDIARWLREGAAALKDVPGVDLSRRTELADFAKGEQIRARITETVKDPRTAEALKAWYYIFCKRPTFNDEYLEGFNRPNVTLVDTQGRGVERITPAGVVSEGLEYEVDCIVFATGFESGTSYTRRAGYEVQGEDGRLLSVTLAAGLRTLHGFHTDGFPNHFILGLSQNALKQNFTDLLDEQAAHIVGLIAHMKANGLTRLEATAAAVEDWQAVIRARSAKTRAFLADCTPGYYNGQHAGQGEVERGFLLETYGGGPLEFTALMRAWWEDGRMAGLDLD
jgi:cyclohexanone monooxygenase